MIRTWWLATQNPVEQEGTYPLPEAPVDRFMMKLTITYPTKDQEQQILKRMARTKPDTTVDAIISPQDVVRLRVLADEVFVDEKIEEYIVNLIEATRDPAAAGLDIAQLIRYGASPRATIFLAMAARANALVEGRGYVTPQDVKTIAPDVLRHRVILTYEAEAEEKSSDDLVRQILANVDGAMIPAELAKKIRYIQIYTSKAVNDVLCR